MAYSPSCMKTAVHPLKPKGDTETNKHPKPQPAVRPELGLHLDFPGRGSHLVFARFLKPLLFPWSRESVERMSGSWLATFLTPFHNVCASVKARQSTRDGCTAPAPKYRVFSFLLLFLFFFSLASSYVAMFDRSDLLSCNEQLGEKGQMQLPLATSLAAGR